ncbi:MAG: hypothetical protein ACLFSQ_05055 [Candidatus Zixiibacteriota bacterium]
MKNDKNIFHKCPSCGKIWRTRDEFLDDPDLVVIGYQENYPQPGQGFFLFNHNCGTTTGVSVDKFADLYYRPLEDIKPDEQKKPELNAKLDISESYSSYLREILLQIQGHMKAFV